MTIEDHGWGSHSRKQGSRGGRGRGFLQSLCKFLNIPWIPCASFSSAALQKGLSSMAFAASFLLVNFFIAVKTFSDLLCNFQTSFPDDVKCCIYKVEKFDKPLDNQLFMLFFFFSFFFVKCFHHVLCCHNAY